MLDPAIGLDSHRLSRVLRMCESESIYDVVKTYLDAEVAPGAVHFGNVGPGVGDGIVLLAVVHAGDAVEASDGVDEAVVSNDADAAATVAHWSNHRPLARLGVETLRRVEALLAVEAARYEHLVCSTQQPRATIIIIIIIIII